MYHQGSQRRKDGLHVPLLGQSSVSEREPSASMMASMGGPGPMGAGGPWDGPRTMSSGPMGGPGPMGGVSASVNRRTSPIRPSASSGALPRSKNPATIAPGQPAPALRQRDKFVPLPSFQSLASDGVASGEPREMETVPAIFEDLPVHQAPALVPDTSRRGRITLYCIAESFDRKKLDELLKLTYPPASVMSYPDCFYVDYIKGSDDEPGGDIFFFDYGVVACWGMTKNMERTVVRGIASQVQEKALRENEIEIDEFQYNFSVTEKPHVQNDTVTLSKKFIHNHEMKLAISYALAQSTKLSMYERRVVDIVVESKNLPESLAERGEVDISSVEVAKLIGKVFLQKSAVNLLSSVLDTPEFFWHAPDNFQTLYTRVIEYLELGTRVELLNSRFSVLQEMLDMLRDHQNNHHSVRLEWIVIWLIVVEVVVGVFELLGLFGIVGSEHHK